MKRLADSYLLEVKDHKRAHCFFSYYPVLKQGSLWETNACKSRMIMAF